jgi:hydroxyacylglutathione hydrolase
MVLCPTGLFGHLFKKTPLPHQPYEGFEPDIMMIEGEAMNLLNFGIDGMVRHTGGHTPGSIAIELASEDALVGDLIASGILIGGIAFTERAMRPPFEDDPNRVSHELEALVQRGAKRFYMGHGGPLDATAVMRHSRRLGNIAPHRCATCDGAVLPS